MIRRSLNLAALSLSAIGLAVLPATTALGQMSRLKEKDGQFIEALESQGMSELLQRYAQTNDQQDPIIRLNTQIALNRIAATDTWNRAISAYQQNNPQEGNRLAEQSRVAFKSVIDAHRQLITDNPDDERLPIWQTDLADLLLGTYLARYFNSATWYYEYGVPTPEQKQAFEQNVVLALEMTDDATRRLDRLVGRLGSEDGLRQKLEDLGIWYKMQEEYAKLKTPLWYGHACHYVALLPREHPYFQQLGANAYVKNQRASVAEEKTRLRDLAVISMRGELLENANTQNVCRLIAGSAMVRKGGRDNADLGIQTYLDPVIGEVNDTWIGFLATMSRAVGRAEAGETDIAIDILSGIGNHPYVQADSSITSRLIAADLMHRLLMDSAEKAQGAAKADLISRSYTEPYLPLIQDKSRPWGALLFARWAEQVKSDVDIQTLPAMVRMGAGERLTQEGAASAWELWNIAQQQPAELANRAAQRDQTVRTLNRAREINQTLTGESVDDAVRARGISNLAMAINWIWRMNQVFENDQSLELFLETAKLYATIAIDLPDTEPAEQAATQALAALQQLDHAFNVKSGGIQRRDIRELYTNVADRVFDYWPQSEVAHNNRTYAGAYIYEASQQWEKAVAVYRGCPREHRAYFECQTQMMWVLRRQYRVLFDDIEVMENAPPEDMNAEQQATFDSDLSQMKVDLDRVRRELLDDATLLEANAELAVGRADNPVSKFQAALAWGAAKVVSSQMLGDTGETEKAMAKLEGFENQFRPTGQFEDLITQQPDAGNAKENLNGLIRAALESRILVLVRGGRTAEAVPEARRMMDAFPDSASSVINGVLDKLSTEIAKQISIRDNTVLDRVKNNAQQTITSYAKLAVDLGEMVVEWAEGRGLRGPQLLVYERDLARSYLMAEQPAKAAEIMDKWLEEFPKEPNLAMLGGDIHYALGKTKVKDPKNFAAAREQYNKIITAYNSQPAKPPIYWEAWYKNFLIDDYLGGKWSRDIPNRIRKLQNFDPNLGGIYKDEMIGLMNKHLAAGG